MKTKSLLSLVVCLALLFATVTFPVSAVTPRWTNADYVEIVHYNDSGTARFRIGIHGYPGTTLIDNVDIKLYRISGNILVMEGCWLNLSQEGDVFDYTGEASPVISNRTYRLQYSADVHRNGTVETISGYHDVLY